MAERDIIRMSVKELSRLSIIRKVIEKQITQVEAGQILNLSSRQIRRKAKRVIEEGDKGVIHRLRGRTSNRTTPSKIKDKILNLCRRRYRGFSPTFASEKLFEIEKIAISAEALRLWFIEENIEYKRRRGRKHRRWRERKLYLGEMVQADGSHHDWLEGRGPECVLMSYTDDATSRFFGRFYEYEGTFPAMESFRRYIRKYGIPKSVYIDKHTTYKSSAKPSIEDELNNREPLTQFGRALRELGVEVNYANSPQAKGRIERSFRTHQDRLIKEMRLKGVSTVEEANRFLSSYYAPKHNRKFTVSAKERVDLHRPIPQGLDLDRIFCLKREAVLRNDFTIAYDRKLYQILDQTNAKKVTVEERMNGRIFISYKGKKLRYQIISQRPPKETPQQPSLPKPKKTWVPPISHPWKGAEYRRRRQEELTKEEEEHLLVEV